MQTLYDSKSKSISDRGVNEILSGSEKLKTWLLVEAELAKAQAEEGFIPGEVAEGINQSCKLENLDLEEMERIKAKVGPGFVPFLKVLVKACPKEAGKYVHYEVTTQNIQQTAQLYQMKKVHGIFGDVR